MTAADPLDSHPGPAGPTVSRNCFVSVLGAGRVVATAAGEELGHRELIDADRPQDQPAHRPEALSSFSRTAAASPSRADAGSRRAAGRAINTTSQGIPTLPALESFPSSPIRAASRTRRR